MKKVKVTCESKKRPLHYIRAIREIASLVLAFTFFHILAFISSCPDITGSLTVIHYVFPPLKGPVIDYDPLSYVDWPDDTFLPQIPHEELQSNKCKHTKTEDGQNHHVRQLLHRLDQGAHDGLQAC